MALVKLELPPGVYSHGTDYQSSGRWHDSNLVRCFTPLRPGERLQTSRRPLVWLLVTLTQLKLLALVVNHLALGFMVSSARMMAYWVMQLRGRLLTGVSTYLLVTRLTRLSTNTS